MKKIMLTTMPSARNTMCTMADGEGYRGRCGIFSGVVVHLASSRLFDLGVWLDIRDKRDY